MHRSGWCHELFCIVLSFIINHLGRRWSLPLCFVKDFFGILYIPCKNKYFYNYYRTIITYTNTFFFNFSMIVSECCIKKSILVNQMGWENAFLLKTNYLWTMKMFESQTCRIFSFLYFQGEAKNLPIRSHGSVAERDVCCALSLDQEEIFRTSTIDKTLKYVLYVN